MKFFWTYKKDDVIFNYEFLTKAEAQNIAQSSWEDYVSENYEGLRNGEIHSEEVELIHFYYDDDGERVIDQREKYDVEYEHYHGDLEEHGTWR